MAGSSDAAMHPTPWEEPVQVSLAPEKFLGAGVKQMSFLGT